MSSRHPARYVLYAASGLALAASAGLAGTKITVEQAMARHIATMGLAAETIAANPLDGHVELRGLHGDIGTNRVRIGSARFASGYGLIAPALAAEKVSLRDITVSGDAVSLTIPRLDAAGSTFSEADLRRLFDRTAPEKLSDRLARFSAEAITIPSIEVTQKSGQINQQTTYRDVALKNIANGRIGSVEGASGTMTLSGLPDVSATGTFGRWSVAAIDSVAMARVYGETARRDEPMSQIYGQYAFENFRLTYTAGFTVSVGRITSDGLKARPGEKPLAEVLTSFSGDVEKLSADEQTRLAATSFALVANFEIGATEATDIRVEGASDGKAFAGLIRRIAFSGGGASANFSIDGIDVSAPGTTVKFGSVAVRDFSMASSFSAIKDALLAPDKDIDPKLFVPKIGSFELADIDIDTKGEGPKATPFKGRLKGFLLAFPQTLDNLPTAVSMKVDSLAFSLPEKSSEDAVKSLKALGYSGLNVSMALSGAWNEATSDFVVSDLSASGVGMGDIKVSGLLGDVSRDVFSGDAALAQVALVSATAKALNVTIVDGGLADRWIASEARKQRRKPEDVRRDYGAAAAMLAPGLLGPGEQSRTLGAAVGRFIAKPGKLTVDVKTKDGQGLGFADVMMASDPREIVGQLTIDAKAE